MLSGRITLRSKFRFGILISILSLSILVFFDSEIVAQSGTNTTGNGGRHIIQGRIYTESGRRAAIQGLKVVLQSSGSADLTTFVDSNATFAFKNLVPGNYLVIIEGSDSFEPVHESAYIDAPGGSSSISGMPRLGSLPVTVPLQIFLKPKRVETLRNEVLNAKWSMIPHDAVQHFKRGIELLQSGKDADAETEFRSSVAIAPNFAPAQTRIGNLELKAGKLEPAVESFKNAIRSDTSDFDANMGLGIAYLNLNKLDEAEAPLVNAAYIDRFAVTPHYYLGRLFWTKGDGDVAQKAFEKVLELGGGKSFPIVHRLLGRIYMHKLMDKQAIAEFETYLNLLPAAKDAEATKKDIAAIKTRPKTTE